MILASPRRRLRSAKYYPTLTGSLSASLAILCLLCAGAVTPKQGQTLMELANSPPSPTVNLMPPTNRSVKAFTNPLPTPVTNIPITVIVPQVEAGGGTQVIIVGTNAPGTTNAGKPIWKTNYFTWDNAHFDAIKTNFVTGIYSATNGKPGRMMTNAVFAYSNRFTVPITQSNGQFKAFYGPKQQP